MAGIAVAVAAVVTLSTRRETGPPFDLRKARISRVTEGGNATAAAISPDGRTVAYAESDGDRYSIWLRQGATGGKVQLVPPEAEVLTHLTFHPGGKDLYFTRRDAAHNAYVLYRIPTTGGAETLVLRDVDTPVSFAPDGTQFVFMRQVGNGEYRIVIADVGGGRQRILAVRKTPRMYLVRRAGLVAGWTDRGGNRRRPQWQRPVDRRTAVGGGWQQPRDLRHGEPDWPCAVAARRIGIAHA